MIYSNIPAPSQLAKIINAPLYSTEAIKLSDKIIKAHLFIGSCDWYITEYDERQDTAFGYANLGNDQCADWGYIMIRELRQLRVNNIFPVEYDEHWNAPIAKDVKKILHK